MSVEQAARAYADFFATLKPETTHRLRELAVEDLVFEDPFNDLNGIDRVVSMLDHMFETTVDPLFKIKTIAVQDKTALITWDFTCTTKSRRPFEVSLTGASELRFNEQSRLIEHIDYWDASSQLYARLPLIGGFFRWLANRFAAPV